MRIVGLIQARMGSTRLPGKVLKEINGLPLIVHIYRRLLACRELDDVGISWGGSCEPLDNGPRFQAWVYPWRNNETDLISRHLNACIETKADAFVRITADCLFHDPAYIDSLVRDFRDAYPKLRGMSNWKGGRSISEGLDAEIYTTEFLAELDRDPKCPREDFATYASKMDCVGTWSPWTRKDMGSDLHLSIDTPDDFKRGEKMLEILGNDNWDYQATLEAYHQVTGVR